MRRTILILLTLAVVAAVVLGGTAKAEALQAQAAAALKQDKGPPIPPAFRRMTASQLGGRPAVTLGQRIRELLRQRDRQQMLYPDIHRRTLRGFGTFCHRNLNRCREDIENLREKLQEDQRGGGQTPPIIASQPPPDF